MILTILSSTVGRYLIGALAISAALFAAYSHVKGTGYAECKAEWNAAEAKAVIDGNRARVDGERDAARGVPDGFDRDQQ